MSIGLSNDLALGLDSSAWAIEPPFKFGRNTDIDAGGTEDVWSGGGNWVAPTAARIHQIVSTDVNDTAAGTGARVVRVYGLPDWDTPEVNEDVTMNGTTNVATANTYVIIHRMKIIPQTDGGGINAGAITATADTDSTVTARIEIGVGQTEMAIYGVPTGQSLVLSGWGGSINKDSSAGAADILFLANPLPGSDATIFLRKANLGLQTTGTSQFWREFRPWRKFAGPCLFKVRATASANNTDISAEFDGMVI